MFDTKRQLITIFLILLVPVMYALAIVSEVNNYLFISIGVFGISCLSIKIFQKPNIALRLDIFFLSIALSFITVIINWGPFQVTLPDLIIIFISCTIILAIFMRQLRFNLSLAEIVLLVFALLEIMGGFINCLHFGHFPLWVRSCVVPSFIFFNCFLLITSNRDIKRAILFTILSISLFAAFTIICVMLGYGHQIASQREGGQLSATVDIGIIKYYMWANWLSAIAAMIFPVFFLRSIVPFDLKYRWLNIFCLFVVLCMAFLGGSRGGALSIVFSALVIAFLALTRLKKSGLVAKYLLIVIFILFVGVNVFSFRVSVNVENKFMDLFYNQFEVANVQIRMGHIYNAYNNLLTHPIGIGYEALWITDNIDQANFISWFANGAGLMGVLGFWGISFTLLIVFIRGLFASNLNSRFYSILGVSTLLATLVTANSSQDFLSQTQTNLPFWLLMGATFKSQFLPRITESAGDYDRYNKGDITSRQ